MPLTKRIRSAKEDAVNEAEASLLPRVQLFVTLLGPAIKDKDCVE